MNHQEVIIYKSALAYYTVKQDDGNSRIAELQQYDGCLEQMPPRKVVYLKRQAQYQPSLIEDVCRALGKMP